MSLTRKRSGSGSKRQFREKVVQIYECLLKGEDVAQNNPLFWDEFFLLKPKVDYIHGEIQKMSEEQLQVARPNLYALFLKCLDILDQEHNIRVSYGLQTMCVLLHALHSNAIEVLEMGYNDEKILRILSASKKFLEGECPDVIKGLWLKVILILSTLFRSINDNHLIEDIMYTPLFDCLVKLLCDVPTRQRHGHDVVMIITLLVNYRHAEAGPHYKVKLSILNDELALNGYGQVITSSLSDFCNQFNSEHSEPRNASWLSSLTSMVGNMFISEEGGYRTQQIRANNALLVAFYEAIHLNRYFITTLAQTQTDASLPPSPNNTLATGQSLTDLSLANYDVTTQPSNLLVTFFQYCSIVMQDTKTEEGSNTVKLCFLILRCITEDQYANILMNDESLTFKVRLHRLPMRHRKVSYDKTTSSQPLVSTLLDLLVEFILSHMMKQFPVELYIQCIDVILRILCHQKRCRIRLNYLWKELWTALIALFSFILQHENYLINYCGVNIFELCIKVVNIINFFITYGDSFLLTPRSYDELYYEVIRRHEIFDNIHSMGLRYCMGNGFYKEDALKLSNALFNVRAIIKHFNPKIEQWLVSANLSTPSEEQILEIVKKNYDSLTLKLQDLLDHYERYAEKPRYTGFFNQMVVNIVSDTRNTVFCSLKNVANIATDFPVI